MLDNSSFASQLERILPKERILSRAIDRVAYASDASFYHLVPQVVVQPETVAEVQALFRFSQQQGVPLCFRAAGTSLSGQSITDGILADLSRGWRKITVEQNGDRVRLQPGVIGAEANVALRPYARRIGPDPASIDSAMLGGMVANNSSGMCCGVIENAYHTLESLRMVLPNGALIDTADPQAGQHLITQAPDVAAGLMDLRAEILSNPALCQRIRAKYGQKNTTGYSLNAFLDYDTPEQILAHVMVGSEGTLGFIAEVVLRGLPAYPYKSTALLLFPGVREAAAAVFPLRDSGARAIEFMDRASLHSVETEEGIGPLVFGLPESAAALLVEYQVSTPQELAHVQQAADGVVAGFALLRPASFTQSPEEQAIFWKIRKGLYPSIGGMRPAGSSVLIEDVAFPVERLAEAVVDLQALFVKHGYNEAIIFGHAKDGNLHFVLTPSFEDQASIQRYAAFIDDVVALVVQRYDGALKAEHGTGRNMAPFVAQEWGQQAYALMARLKDLVDPTHLLNPDVIINADPQAHLQHLKTWARVEEEVDRCMECGFCEPKCPSRDLTMTPRRRIVTRREIARLQTSAQDNALLEALVKDYQYDGKDTCALDGYCAIACPLHINTGDLIKRLRGEAISTREQALAARVAQRFAVVEDGLRLGVGLAKAAEKVIGVGGVRGITVLAEKVARTALPKWSGVVPRPIFKRLPTSPRELAEVVYFPSCIARVLGTSPRKQEATLPEVMVELSRRAGIAAWIPPDSKGVCCGMPFGSKGYSQAFQETAHRTITDFWEWSQGGKLPVVIDSSSCAYTLLMSGPKMAPADWALMRQMTLLDPMDYAFRYLLPRLKPTRLPRAVMLHPNCSAVKLGLSSKMEAVARACAESVTIPNDLKCCGYAGDRGLLFPELTESATRPEAAEVNQRSYDGYYSSNITCEMGMTQATGQPYQSILYLLEAASRGSTIGLPVE